MAVCGGPQNSVGNAPQTLGPPSVQGVPQCLIFVSGSSSIRTHVLVITMRTYYRCATLTPKRHFSISFFLYRMILNPYSFHRIPALHDSNLNNMPKCQLLQNEHKHGCFFEYYEPFNFLGSVSMIYIITNLLNCLSPWIYRDTSGVSSLCFLLNPCQTLL